MTQNVQQRLRRFTYDATYKLNAFFISNVFCGLGSDVAWQNPKFPEIGVTLPDKTLFGKREESFGKGFRVRFSIFSEILKIGKFHPSIAYKSVAYKRKSV